MARQARLMESLGPPKTATHPRPAAPTLSHAEIETLRNAEALDVATAFDCLESGDLVGAAAPLRRHAVTARETKTLTTLSRVLSAQGDLDGALEVLKRADALDPSDAKVAYFMAGLLELQGRHHEAIQYRRRVAFSKTEVPAAAYVALMGAVVRATPLGHQPPPGEIRLALSRLRAAADLDNALRQAAAKLLFKVKAFKRDAHALCVEVNPCQPGERDIDASWRAMPDWCQSNGVPIRRDLEAGKPARRPMVAELSDAIVHPCLHWQPLVDEGRVLLSGIATGRLRTHDELPHSPVLLDDGKAALLRLPREMRRIDTPALLVGGAAHYFHDTVEYVGSLYVAEHLNEVGQLPLVVNADMTPQQAELLELLGYGRDRLIPVDTDAPLQFARLKVPSRPLVGGRWIDPALAAWYRHRLVGAAAPRRATRKLYVSRHGASSRRIGNEEAVLDLLTASGYECVLPETLSVRQQVDLFSEASHVVGAMGAALTNLLYAPPGARAVVLHNRQAVELGADLYYDALGNACGHEVSVLDCAASQLVAGRNAIDADLTVDVDLLREALR